MSTCFSARGLHYSVTIRERYMMCAITMT